MILVIVGIVLMVAGGLLLAFAGHLAMTIAKREDRMSQRWLERKWLEEHGEERR